MSSVRAAYIVDALRTPIGKLRGALSAVRADDLLAHCIRALVLRTHPVRIHEVVAGCANQAGDDNRNVARMATLLAGLPEDVPALTVNRLCSSGLDAVILGARSIAVGDAEVVVAGGVESMTRAPWVMEKPDRPFASAPRIFDTALGWRFPNPELAKRFPLESMGETAENIAERTGITRSEQDAFALASHQRAVRAQAEGLFAAELVALPSCSVDEGPRADTSQERLAALPPVFRAHGSVTAGNSASLNDGAAVVLVAAADAVAKHGWSPMARIVASASVGVDPRLMGLGPIPAVRRVLDRSGWAVSDLDAIELNEAFAVQALAVIRELELPEERVNARGGAIALGHPLGCSGARILTTLVHRMRQEGLKRGLATLCVGVGQGVALAVERD